MSPLWQRAAGRLLARRGSLAWALLACALTPQPAPAAESFAQQLVRAGEVELLELRYAEAVAYLSEALKLAEASSSAADRALAPRAYELRAIAHLNLGDAPAAERDFAALLEFEPGRDLERSSISPKILAVFDRVRAARTGLLTLRCDPPDCKVRLGPEKVEILAPIIDKRVRAGEYLVHIERQGFEPLEETWKVAPGQKLARAVRLLPNSQSFQVLTIPPGAAVLLDGVAVGTTRGPAPVDYQARAHQEGVTLAELSAPLLVPYVSIGKHELRLERECHQTTRFALEVHPDMRSTQPITFKPVRLKTQLATLEVQGSPAGAEVRMDGAPIGRLPLRREGVCAGQHRVEVVFPTGASWAQSVEIPAGGILRVQARPRPTLAFLGLVQLGSEVRADRRLVEAKLGDLLGRVARLNVDRRDRQDPVRAGWASLVGAAPVDSPTGDLLAVRLGEWVRTAREARAGADLLLGAVLRRRGIVDEVHLYLASTLGEPAEVRRAAAESGALATAFADLDRPIDLQETWAGWTAVDLPGGGPPVLSAVVAGGPAARAGLRPGERVRALDGEEAGDAAGLGRLLAAVEPGEAVRVERISADGSPGTLALTPVARPRVLPLQHPALLYHAAHAHLQSALLGGGDPAIARVAAINMAVVLLHFGRAEEALVSFLEPRSGGALEAVVQYLRARALERLGQKEAAREAYRAAARGRPSDLEPPDLPVGVLAAEAAGPLPPAS